MPVITTKKNICECGVEIPYNLVTNRPLRYCDPCREKHKKASQTRAQAMRGEYQRNRIAKEKAELAKMMPPSVKPKSRAEPTMTNAEQTKIDMECRARDIERRGLLMSPGRSLSPAEIEAIKNQITPPGKITNFEPGFNATY